MLASAGKCEENVVEITLFCTNFSLGCEINFFQPLMFEISTSATSER